jgi:hypothetical protein
MARMSKLRSEDEQKAVETILWALGHRLARLRDEYTMKVQRGEEPEGVTKGFEMALREINDMLPRRKRFKG